MKKKKLLFLSQVYPHPADGGGKIKTLNSIITLAKEFDVYAVFVSEKKPSADEIDRLKKYGVEKIKVFYNPKILESVKADYLHLIKNFLRLNPHYVFQYTYAPAYSYIQNAIKSFKPNIIHVDHINIAQYLPREKKEVWILEHHNLEFYLLWTRFLHSKKWSRKFYLLIESTLTYLFEKQVIKRFDHIFAISKPEEIRIRNFFNIDNVSTQPLIQPILKIKKEKHKNPIILFIGSLIWPPNEDAVEWFSKKIFPKILIKIPNAEFHVVGKKKPEVINLLPKHPQIIIHGFQKNLNPYLKKADIFVLSFKMGGGVRIKSLTALSAGIPIVSTKLGVEGINLINNTHFLEANSETEFAEKVIKLLKSKVMQKQMSNNQKDYLKKFHSPKENLNWIKKYYQVL